MLCFIEQKKLSDKPLKWPMRDKNFNHFIQTSNFRFNKTNAKHTDIFISINQRHIVMLKIQSWWDTMEQTFPLLYTIEHLLHIHTIHCTKCFLLRMQWLVLYSFCISVITSRMLLRSSSTFQSDFQFQWDGAWHSTSLNNFVRHSNLNLMNSNLNTFFELRNYSIQLHKS